MITNPNPIAATYEADIHCIACAEQRFGQALYESGHLGAKIAEDSEGNQPGLIYSWDYEQPEEGPNHCGTCGDEIK